MSDQSYGSYLADGITYVDERALIEAQKEIANLRELIGLWFGDVGDINDKCVALGEAMSAVLKK